MMSASDLAIVAALIFAWGTLSARLERFDVTAPIVFVVAGVVLTHGPLAPLGFAPSHELVKSLAEITLVLVLFSDASRVGLRDLRTDMTLCLRLLGVRLPLTIGLGTLLAFALFNGMSIWLATMSARRGDRSGPMPRSKRPTGAAGERIACIIRLHQPAAPRRTTGGLPADAVQMICDRGACQPHPSGVVPHRARARTVPVEKGSENSNCI